MTGKSALSACLAPETFQKFRKLIYEKTSINMREGKQILVANRLRKRLAAVGASDYEEYYRYLTEGGEDREELSNFIDAVTTNETYFYRETSHLEVLRETILPALFARRRRIAIWSAGCSTGEEPYTLKILLEQGRGRLWNGDADIVATDISRQVIEKAKRGEFRERSLRVVPGPVRDRFFTPVGDDLWAVRPEIREGVRFLVHNLLKDPPPLERCDIIFCRNVMIYFDKPTQARLADGPFARVLDPAGYLCIGHAESLTGTSSRFQFIRGMGAAVYRKAEGEPAS